MQIQLPNQVSVQIGKQTRTFLFNNLEGRVWWGISTRTKKGAPKAAGFKINESGELEYWYSFNIVDTDKNCFPNGFTFEPKEAPSISL